jgi:hypothetical protein
MGAVIFGHRTELSLNAFKRILLASTIALHSLALSAPITLFDNGEYALLAATRPGIVEAPVPVFVNGAAASGGVFNVIETYDQVPGTSSYPLLASHLAANTFQRFTYEKPDGTSASLGTSIVGSMSFRTDAGLQYVPSVTRADVTTGIPQRYQVAITGAFGPLAETRSTVTVPDPVVGRTVTQMETSFFALSDIALAVGAPVHGNDRFRAATFSSMYSSSSIYDGNVIRFEDTHGVVHTFVLTDATPRDAHLFDAPIEIGSWFEILKTAGSTTWFEDSPSLRIMVLDAGGMRLGLQGFLAGTRNPNDDSLSLYLEWLDAPDVLAAGSALGVRLQVEAFATDFSASAPAPATWLLVLAGLPLLGALRRTHAPSQ